MAQPPRILWRDCPACGWRTYPHQQPMTNGSVWSSAWKPSVECGGCGTPLEIEAEEAPASGGDPPRTRPDYAVLGLDD